VKKKHRVASVQEMLKQKKALQPGTEMIGEAMIERQGENEYQQ